jgi:hypothetical protein|nr:MAG TPA: hypothetical protein [Crassvirales sp.]
MEKKYPVLKCNKELWNEIKPVLESFGITDFNVVPNWNNNIYLISNYGYIDKNEIFIGNDKSSKINHKSSLRYLVNTKEEFLSAIAKLLGKEYPIKEQSSEAEYPCIKCTQQLYDSIKDILEIVGYEESKFTDFKYDNILVINLSDEFGQISNVCESSINGYNRYLCSNIQEFLTKACELKGYTVSYINNTHCNDAENHYFGYCANNETKTIDIYENAEESGLQAIVVEKSVVPKKKKENDLNINKDMEKINIADKLKHCKKGTKLYSPLFGEVEFENVDDKIEIIVHTDEEEIYKVFFEKDGKYYIIYKDAECLLFPSKDNRNWNDFQVLEEGHRVMVSDNGENWSLRKYYMDDEAYRFSDDADSCNSHIYIVPVEDFDFTAEDITINKEKSIV